MNQFKQWLESRLAEYGENRARALKAYDTRIKRMAAERNDGAEPTESSTGFHAPYDGYVWTWWKGDQDYERPFLGGQWLPYSSDRDEMYESAGTLFDHGIKDVPVDRADRFVEMMGSLDTDVRDIVLVSRSRSWTREKDLQEVCYVNITKCPKDIYEALLDYLMGDIIKLQRFAEQKAEEERAARDAAHEAGADVENGRQVITGTVLAMKWQESDYGDTLKMLVQADSGFRVWGSVPSSLADDLERENHITFTATVQQSKDSSKFGFFKRPSKAQINNQDKAA